MAPVLRPLVIVLLLTLPFVGRGVAQDRPSTTIRLVGEAVRNVDPAALGTALFEVDHAGRDTVDTQLEIGLPDGWTLSAQPGPTALSPRTALRRLVAFRVPERALPGVARVRVALIDAAGDTLDTASALVRVADRRAIEVAASPGPPASGTDRLSRIRFEVANRGNTYETVDLMAASSLDLPIVLHPGRLSLDPFSSESVTVEVVEPEVALGLPHTVLLVATATDRSGERMTATVVARTDGADLAWSDAWPAELVSAAEAGAFQGTWRAVSDVPGSDGGPYFVAGADLTPVKSTGSALSMRVQGTVRRDLERTGLVSIDGEWRLSRSSSLQAAYGVGARGDKAGTTLRTRLIHANPTSRLDLQYQSGTDQYPGASQASRQLAASASQAFGSSASVDAAFGQVQRSTGPDRSGTTTGYSQLGTGWRFRPLGRLRATASFSAHHRFREDQRAGQMRSEAYGAGSLTLAYPWASAKVTIDQGRTTGATGSTPFYRSDIALSLRWRVVNLSANWVREDGPRYLTLLETERNLWSVQASVDWSPRVRTGFQVFTSAFEDPSVTRSRSADGRLEVEVGSGHRIAAHARVARVLRAGSDETDIGAGLSYRMPMNVPARKPATGISGRILHADSGEPVRDAVIALGEHVARTGADGRFALHPSASGAQLLVSAGPRAPGLVVLNPGVLNVARKESTRTPLEILMGPGAVIDGQVIPESVAGPADGIRPVEGLAVAATDGLQTRFAVAGEDGRFSFEGLAPGTWTVSLAARSPGTDAAPDIVWVASADRFDTTLMLRNTDRAPGDRLARLASGYRGPSPGLWPAHSIGAFAPGTAGQMRLLTTDSPVNPFQWVR